MKVLFASAEIFPYAKTGGLADVAQALPDALHKDVDIVSVMPLYSFIDTKHFNIKKTMHSFTVILGKKSYEVSLFESLNKNVHTLFVDEKNLADCITPYADKRGEHPLNRLRFALFSKAVVKIAELLKVDALHLNDWHTALGALWAKELLPDLHTIFTIHNLAFQGIFKKETLQELGVDNSYFTPEGIEFWGDINYMKAGIAYSDVITTVSPTYKREIILSRFGCGLEGFLHVHEHKLYGIVNGIDTAFFNPTNDTSLHKTYSLKNLAPKKSNKLHFCKEHNLSDPHKPLTVFIGRFSEQKGLDVIINALEKVLALECNIAILGDGDALMSQKLKILAETHLNLSVKSGYDEGLSHQMYSAADFLLMPSRFEPCGLNQLIALRYGTIPIVNDTGGLHDTIQDFESVERSLCGHGIVMRKLSSSELYIALERALQLFENRKKFLEVQKADMRCDVSFTKSAQAYQKLYRKKQ
ncbi:MAG: glycogen synthase [Epsilonproteobacteria bacterium]|nr:MAG: glycogen synthase [Campylobacterota bacterium]